MSTIERIAEGCTLGEGPHWDIASQSLYFVDIVGSNILKYVPATKQLTKVSVAPKQPTFIIPVEDKKDQFIVSLTNELAIISWDGQSDKISVVEQLNIAEQVPKGPNVKFNDGKCDSSGRLWAGVHEIVFSDINSSPPLGILYSLDSNRQLKSHVKKIRVTNGLAFNDKTKKMFYIDSLAYTVDQFDFDITTGSISNRKVWFSLKKFDIPGIPDGMTIDTDGNLWVANFGGSRVLKIDGNKSETLLDTIHIPAEQVTSVTFGGKNLDELYVTTGALEHEGKKQTPTISGATYKVTGVGSKGLRADNFKLNA